MALSLKDPEADRLAREVAARTGETLTTAVIVALRERLARRCADLPTLDDRSPEEIVGYDHRGLPR
jgi:antitoxin VapB